jgi:hypothetical protein
MNRNRQHQHILTLTGLLLVALLSFGLFGCSESPVAPEQPIPVDQIVSDIGELPFPAPAARTLRSVVRSMTERSK